MERKVRSGQALWTAVRFIVAFLIVMLLVSAITRSGDAVTFAKEKQYEWNRWVDDLMKLMNGPPYWRAAAIS